MGLVRSIAMRFCGRGTEYEDLVQIGTIGMLKAIRSFDSERGTAFSTYAVPLIVGEIRRHLRDDGIIKISRCQRKLGMDLRAAEQRIMNEEGRTPHIEELATACGVSPEEAAVALEATTPILSLSTALNGEEGTELENYGKATGSDCSRAGDSSVGSALEKNRAFAVLSKSDTAGNGRSPWLVAS